MFEPQDKQLQQQNQTQAREPLQQPPQGTVNTSPIQPRPRPPQPRPPSPVSSALGQERAPIPSNLPVGEQLEPQSTERRGALTEDIFSQTDDIPVFSPPPAPLASSEPQIPPQLRGAPHTKRKVVVFILSAFIVAFFLIAGYLVYHILQARQNIPSEAPSPIPVNTSPEIGNVSSNNSNTAESGSGAGGNGEGSTEEGTGLQGKPNNSGEIRDEEAGVQSNDAGDDTTAKNNVPPPTKEPEGEAVEPSSPKEPAPPKDSDGDGLLDIDELQIGSNPNVIDTDFDGLDDYAEVRIHGTNPLEKDTDGDGLPDGEEVKVGSDPKIADTDGDGVNDYMEVRTYKSDPSKRDTDQDGYDDGKEIQNGYSPIGTGKL